MQGDPVVGGPELMILNNEIFTDENKTWSDTVYVATLSQCVPARCKRKNFQ
jgi:hypothetical protein